MTALEWQHALAALPPSITVAEFDVTAINSDTDDHALALRHADDEWPAAIMLKGWHVNEMVSRCPRGDTAEIVRRLVEYVDEIVEMRRRLAVERAQQARADAEQRSAAYLGAP